MDWGGVCYAILGVACARRLAGIMPHKGSGYGNQFLQLDPEPKPSPLGGKTPPLRGRWHEVPEGEQVAATNGSRRMRGE